MYAKRCEMLKKSFSYFLPIVCIFIACFLLASYYLPNTLSLNTLSADKKYRIAIITNTIKPHDVVNATAVKVLNDLLREHDFELIHITTDESFKWVNAVSDIHEENPIDLLVGTGWEASEMFPIIESKYDDLHFLVIDNKLTFSAIKSVYFTRFECSYILGAMMATAFPEENIFGFIGNFDTAYSEIQLNGYTEGLLSVNPKAQVQADFTKNYDNDTLAYELIKQQHEFGITFVMSTLSPKANAGVYKYAQEAMNAGNPIYTNGMDIDQTSKERPFILTSIVKNIELGMRIGINDIFRNGYDTKNIKLGLFDNGSNVLFASTHYANFHNTDIITEKVMEIGHKTADNIKGRYLIFPNTPD